MFCEYFSFLTTDWINENLSDLSFHDEVCLSIYILLFPFRSTELDSNWNWFQLRCMQVGGNANAVSRMWHSWIYSNIPCRFLQCDSITSFSFCLKTAFFRQHGCSTNDTNAKYNSRAAQMYREKIRQQANAALSKYGTDVSIGQMKTVWGVKHIM